MATYTVWVMSAEADGHCVLASGVGPEEAAHVVRSLLCAGGEGLRTVGVDFDGTPEPQQQLHHEQKGGEQGRQPQKASEQGAGASAQNPVQPDAQGHRHGRAHPGGRGRPTA